MNHTERWKIASGHRKITSVIIPAHNEERSIAYVLDDIPRDVADEIIVVNNNSSDLTGEVAAAKGATVLYEERQGYGYACMKGLEYLQNSGRKPDLVVFLDADYSDYPHEMGLLVRTLTEEDYDLVIGSRVKGKKVRGSMAAHQLFGNWLATSLLRYMYGADYTDLGPFRAIRYDKLRGLNMSDTTYGWTIEMQIKAAKKGYRHAEVPVSYRTRIGRSKISGTLSGSFKAGCKILYTIFKYA